MTVKTTLLLIRHGFSTSNEDGTLTGQLDVPLTPLGVRQGEAASRYLFENYGIDAIYSSDLSRAVDTVRPLSEQTGLPILTDPDLREMRCGIWTGVLISELKTRYGALYTRWASADDAVFPEGGESWSKTAERMRGAVLRIAAQNAGKTVAVATHGGALRALLGVLLGIPSALWQTELPYAPNASVTRVTYEDGCFVYEGVTDEYLGTLKTEMPKGL
jgi:broad specificity phosphatase PhoE